ncbi:hypothetical protein D9M68_347480 [compost metagenome]
MVGAAENRPRVSATLSNHLCPFMRAAIVKHVNLAAFIPDHDHGVPANKRSPVVTRVGHLAFMADVDPSSTKDPVHLELKNIRIGVDILMNMVRINQIVQP